VGSSSTKPSRCNVRCSHIAREVSTDGDSSTVAASEISVRSESVASWLVCSTGVAGAMVRGAAWPALMRAAVLSFFLFALPLSV
jgi:hypothetical protein